MKLTLEEKMKIVELKQQGVGYKTIAKQFKVTYSLIQNIWYTYSIHGVKGIMHPPNNRKYSVDLKLEIIKRVYNGESQTRLAAEYNIHGPGTIYSWMKKYEKMGYNGLKRKKGRPRGRPKIMTKEKNENTRLSNDEREELIRLRKEKEYLEMENAYLKKLDALVKKRLKQQRKKK